MSLVGKYLKLTKLEDLRFEGNHPNGINRGYVLQGWCIDTPEPGYALYLYTSKSIVTTPSAWTSAIVEVDYEKMIVTTKNSKYSIEVVENAQDITKEDLEKALKQKLTILR